MDYIEYNILSSWLNYFVNGDLTPFDDIEIEQIKKAERKIVKDVEMNGYNNYMFTFEENSEEFYSNDFTNLWGEIVKIKIVLIEEIK